MPLHDDPSPRPDVFGCERYSVLPRASLGAGRLRRLAAACGFATQAYLALASLVMPPVVDITPGGAAPERRRQRRA